MHWLSPVNTILTSDSTDLRDLAQTVGEDPRTFYAGSNLEGVDICGQDLRGMILTGLDTAKIIFDYRTCLDNKYMREINWNPRAIRVLKSNFIAPDSLIEK